MTPKYLCIHHTAVQSKTKQIWSVDRYHKNKWNMKSSQGWYVGYNYFIDVDGVTYKTRKWGEETIAAKGHNCDSSERCDTVHVCVAGDFRFNQPNKAQRTTLYKLILELQGQLPECSVVFHRNLTPTTVCPGKNVDQDFIANLLNVSEIRKEDSEHYQTFIDQIKTFISNLLNK